VRESTVVVTGGKPAGGTAAVESHVCPPDRRLRDRLRALAADLVASWKTDGLPASVKTSAGLRDIASVLVRRAGGDAAHVGWMMVTIVSEHWRERLASGPNGRRLLLLPDCPCAARAASPDAAATVPQVCGPACGIGTIWTAARDTGWVVESTGGAVAAIGGLLTGQYDGVLGVARLKDLEKAFAMLPAFALPVAAVPCEPAAAAAGQKSCGEALAAQAIDVEWVLGLLGVAGGGAAPVGDYLPLFREATELFTPAGLSVLAARLGVEPSFGLETFSGPERGDDDAASGRLEPLAAAEALGGGFVSRGGKFLRPFVALAAFDAVRADRDAAAAVAASATAPGNVVKTSAGYAVDENRVREAVKAAAVAIEVFHKASLVHDDIEDGDAVRYGRPTLHEEVGIASALNVGDYLLGIGYRIISSLPGVDSATLRDLVQILSAAHVRLARGQGAELWWRDAGDKRLTPDESLAMYGLKTSPAFEAAVAIGIRLAGVAPQTAAAIDRYAFHVGTGFQVLNDLKDWEGDVENDRRAAGDLLGGRPTLMWALAVERLPRPDVERLASLAAEAGSAAASEAVVARCVAEARRLYEQADVFSRARGIVAGERAAAAAAAAGCRLPRLREVLEFLLDLAVPEQAAAGAPGSR
jgi:geranylgeranyl diphosphate synthase type II